MTAQELQDYLYQRIPQASAMQACIEEIDENSLTLSAPLEPNINHRDSVFGGSASSIAILAAWAYLHARLKSLGISTTLVIQRNTMSYDAPILGCFTATASLPESADWDKFLHTLRRRGKARLQVQTHLHYDGKPAGEMQGSFVAVGCQES
ncbi:hypothetical protein Rhal01_01300 [Rubritalea halochordaticola]|uniref:Thioesterase putative domain-containing protein n=1 Tax=Rubritalea halochordaticola TaxID=714537 RepID=A0ABP9UXC5_9BACT